MDPLPTDLRRVLENAVIAARDAAEKAAASAIDVLAVKADKPFASLSEEQRGLRNALRARARALGEGSLAEGIRSLEEEIAYEQWHRMLFARFLAENHLLMHPTAGVPITLEECAELASEEGEPDEWIVAAKYASAMLPGIFRREDPSAHVRLAPDDRQTLEGILRDLPSAMFTADDALGWVYQFWQTKTKKEVNDSGRKIGGKDLPAVTQLFTEHYMVRFLLENSLGAWWASRHPDSPLVKEWVYLRFGDDGTPAAGTFPDWPERAADVTVMDPCCGSGHFLVAAAGMLRNMRVEEEGLSAGAAARAVLRDNIFGLELDARCTQLAAFAVVFDAWKAGLAPKDVVLPNLACSGIVVSGQLEEWKVLAGEDVNLQHTLDQLYHLFSDAPNLGSLIDPSSVPLRDRMFAVDYSKVTPLIDAILVTANDDPVSAVFGGTAEGAALAGALLAREYTLVATNVPYLARSRQSDRLKAHLRQFFPNGQAELATAFLERSIAMCVAGGSSFLVLPHTWLFLDSFRSLRLELLKTCAWNLVSLIGPKGFDTIGGEVVNVILFGVTRSLPCSESSIATLDVSDEPDANSKSDALRDRPVYLISQSSQLNNPDNRFAVTHNQALPRLSEYAASLQGVSPADLPRFGRLFWEVHLGGSWIPWQGSPESTATYAGRHRALHWCDSLFEAAKQGSAYIRGEYAWGKRGVAIGAMGELPAALYTGEKFDTNITVVIPTDPTHLPAIWAYCSSDEYRDAVRAIDKSIKVTNASFVKVPFDIERWKTAAKELCPEGLPAPSSSDPTQWIFRGNVTGSTAPLQVAVSRLLGYRWPDQDIDSLDQLADEDGIVCVPSVAGEKAGSERLRAMMAAAFGDEWSAATQNSLLAGTGSTGKALEQWLRDDFFAQHCRLFQQRPFIWQIWDGRRDGFSALLNYHKLNHANLQKLTYTYLGWWIDVQRNARDSGEAGADARLAAALELQKKLELILAGEDPCDIYVRWKPLQEQPIGWNPDLDDGVRLNVRPFVEAGVLRSKFTIHWKKDRGANPDGSERHNDLHVSIAEKQEARRKAGRA